MPIALHSSITYKKRPGIKQHSSFVSEQQPPNQSIGTTLEKRLKSTKSASLKYPIWQSLETSLLEQKNRTIII
jgi:hypothetical protein